MCMHVHVHVCFLILFYLCTKYACELRPVSGLTVNKYTGLYDIDFFCRLCTQKMCYQDEAHKVYFYYACVKYDVIGYMTSSCHDVYQFIFIFIFNKFRFNLYLLRKSYSFHLQRTIKE